MDQRTNSDHEVIPYKTLVYITQTMCVLCVVRSESLKQDSLGQTRALYTAKRRTHSWWAMLMLKSVLFIFSAPCTYCARSSSKIPLYLVLDINSPVYFHSHSHCAVTITTNTTICTALKFQTPVRTSAIFSYKTCLAYSCGFKVRIVCIKHALIVNAFLKTPVANFVCSSQPVNVCVNVAKRLPS